MLLVCLQRVRRHASRPSRSRPWLFVSELVAVVCMRHLVYLSLRACCFPLPPFLLHAFQNMLLTCKFLLIYLHQVFESLRAADLELTLVSLLGAQPPAGRTSPQRTVWWWRCRPVRPAPGSFRRSWPATCWWPTFCWSTFSSPSLSTYIGMNVESARFFAHTADLKTGVIEGG